jgi:phosphoribosylformylglycinamidine synthase subunit PurL
MAMSGDLGAVVDLSKVKSEGNLDVSTLLFSESHGRYLITVKKEVANEVLSKIPVSASIIGEVGGNSLVIKDNFNVDVTELKNSFYGIIEKFMA